MLAVLSFLLVTTLTTITAREEIMPSMPWKQILQRWKETKQKGDDLPERHSDTVPDDQDEGECDCDCEELCEDARKKENDGECDSPEKCKE